MVQDSNLARFKQKDTNIIVIEILGIEETYEILKFFEFTSERRMMSIAVRQIVADGLGPITIYSKGADSSIKEKCNSNLI